MRFKEKGFLLLSIALIVMSLAGINFHPGTPISTPSPTPSVTQPPAQMGILAPTPPIGWNSWNHFACYVNENIAMETADAMVESGMAALGYEYSNISSRITV